MFSRRSKIHAYLLVACFGLFAVSAQSANVVVTTSASCTSNMGTISDPAACNFSGTPGTGFASASASASYSVAANTLSVNAFDQATANAYNNTGMAISSVTLNLLTSGPLRSGFLLVEGGIGAGTGGAAASTFTGQYSLGINPDTALEAVSENCSSTGGHGPCALILGGPTYPYIPVLLGTDLNFAGTFQATAHSLVDGVSSSAGGVDLVFTFFEADQLTPVDLAIAAPEPGSSGLCLLGLVGCIYAYSRKGRATFRAFVNR